MSFGIIASDRLAEGDFAGILRIALGGNRLHGLFAVLAAALKTGECPALVLNADFRPLSYFPLSLWSWQETIKAVFLERVNIVEEYERHIHAPGFDMRIPSVVSLKKYVKQTRLPAFTRFNVFLRDNFECQYCGSHRDLTFDHVVPRSRGGRTTWENVVTACAPCNFHKGGLMPKAAGMFPRQPPRQPSLSDLRNAGRHFPPNYLHESWVDYLYWDSELEA